MISDCGKCCFIQTENEEQIGCLTNKLDVLKNRFKWEFEGSYKFEGLCPSFRNKVWADRNDNIDLVEKVSKEAKLKPAIFFPIRNMDDIISFKKNYSDILTRSELINIINYSELSIKIIKNELADFDDGRLIITTPIIPQINPDSLIEQNIRLLSKYRYNYIIIIDDASKTPRNNLLDLFDKKIYEEISYIIGVVGEGYFLLLKNLYYHIIKSGETVPEFMLLSAADKTQNAILNENAL